LSRGGGGIPAVDGGAIAAQPPLVSNKETADAQPKKATLVRPRKLSPRRSSTVGSMDTVSEDEAFIEPEGSHKEDDANATFLSAQSNLLDVTASSTGEMQGVAPPMLQSATVPSARHQAFVGASGREQQLGPRVSTKPAADTTGAPPTMMMPAKKPEPSQPVKEEAPKKEPTRKSIKPPPNSAPALMGATKTDKSVSGSPQKEAPSSDKSKYRCVPHVITSLHGRHFSLYLPHFLFFLHRR